jgi:hypothetical protein
MPTYQQTKQAREKARRIRDVAVAFRRESIERRETQGDIRTALQFGSASEFVAEVSQ